MQFPIAMKPKKAKLACCFAMDSKIIETGAHSEAGLFLCMHVDSRRGSIHALCQVAGIAFISAQVAAEVVLTLTPVAGDL